MGLFDLFRKKEAEVKTAAIVASEPAKPVEIAKAIEVVEPAAIVASEPAGTAQVRLRLKLAAAKRAGATARAYEAAKGLADIQAKAGRRTAARVWREEAERILAHEGATA